MISIENIIYWDKNFNYHKNILLNEEFIQYDFGFRLKSKDLQEQNKDIKYDLFLRLSLAPFMLINPSNCYKNSKYFQFLRWKNKQIIESLNEYMQYNLAKIKLVLANLKLKICNKLIILNKNLFETNNTSYNIVSQLYYMKSAFSTEIDELENYIQYIDKIWAYKFLKEHTNTSNIILIIGKLCHESIAKLVYDNNNSQTKYLKINFSLESNLQKIKTTSVLDSLSLDVSLNFYNSQINNNKNRYYERIDLINSEQELGAQIQYFNSIKTCLLDQDLKLKLNIIQRFKIIRNLLKFPNKKLEFNELINQIHSLFRTCSLIIENYEQLSKESIELIKMSDASDISKTELQPYKIELEDIFESIDSLLNSII